jgi:hypothetical protein
VVVNLGWDLFCLEDEGKSAKLAWCQRSPLGLSSLPLPFVISPR